MIITYSADGKMTSVRVDENSPLGILCKLGDHSSEIVYSENQLHYPLRRKGLKETYDFERISWEKAFQEVVGRLNTIKSQRGPEATAIYTGRGSFELALCDVFQPKDVAVHSLTKKPNALVFPVSENSSYMKGTTLFMDGGMRQARDHAEGLADAPLTFVEYGDYQCLYCGAAYPVVKRLQKTLGKKLRFVFRNFPLTQAHPYALIAAEAASIEWLRPWHAT
jgi:hypothetical protein